MTINANDIRAAVDMIDINNTTQWNANGQPKIEVIRRITGDDTVTAADVAAAIQVNPLPVLGQDANPAPLAATGAMHSPQSAVEDDKPDSVGEASHEEFVKRQLDDAKAAKEIEAAKLTDLEIQRNKLEVAIAEQRKGVDKLTVFIDENTAKLSEAEMVKKIQKQTKERLMKQHETSLRVNAALQTSGMKTFPSALDAALAGGAGRSKVLIGGKVFQAPHPRSPEGIRSYADWVHHGAQQKA